VKLFGKFVDTALDRFANWALDRSAAGGPRLDPKSVKQHPNYAGFIAYTIPDAVDQSAYITRVMFPRVFGVRLFLHHIHRPDHDRDMHNHPWAWACSLILRGSYDEERPRPCHHAGECARTATRRVRWFNYISGEQLHRITKLHGDVWTLFFSGPRIAEWGFREWDDDTDSWVITPHAEYIARKRIERMMSSCAQYYADPTHDLVLMRGDDLDRWGAVLDCPRLPGGPDGTEDDGLYRERLVEAVRGSYYPERQS
jgi:hypothetical protein